MMFLPNKYLTVLFLLLIVQQSIAVDIIVDVNSSCSPSCDGSALKPFNNIRDAINAALPSRINYINMLNGTYKGLNNKNLVISSSTIILGATKGNQVTIDCEQLGSVFRIEKQGTVTLNGIKIQHCSGSSGSSISIYDLSTVMLENVTISSSKSDLGSIYVSQSNLIINNATFSSNIAMVSGGAIYACQDSKVTISGSFFSENKQRLVVNEQDTLIYSDLAVDSSFASVDQLGSIKVFCLSPNSIATNKNTTKSICTSANTAPADTSQDNFFVCSANSNTNCSTSFKGFYKQEYFCTAANYTNCSVYQFTYQSTPSFTIMDYRDGPLKGQLVGYFVVPFSTQVYFRFTFDNVGLKLSVNNKSLLSYDNSIQNLSQEPSSIVESNVYLVPSSVHKMVLEYKSNKQFIEGQRYLNMEYRFSTTDSFSPLTDLVFFSQNRCGDGIYDPTEVWNNSEEIRKASSSQSEVSYGAQAGGGFKKISVQASVEFSKSQSVEKSSKLKKSSSGSIIESGVVCRVSKIALNSFPLHPNFIFELSQINSTTQAFAMIQKYGTHYYVSATLGGQLKQFTSTTMTVTESEANSQYSQSLSTTFGASVSSPAFSISADYASSDQTEGQQEQTSKFLSQTERSTLLISGGGPGIFAPGATADYGFWSQSVDVLPVPIDFKLAPIRSLIPSKWKSIGNEHIRDLWINAEERYYMLVKTNQLSNLLEGERVEYNLLYLFIHTYHDLGGSNLQFSTKIFRNPRNYLGNQYFDSVIDFDALPDDDGSLADYYGCTGSNVSSCFYQEFEVSPLFKTHLDPSSDKILIQTTRYDGGSIVHNTIVVPLQGGAHTSFPCGEVSISGMAKNFLVENVAISSSQTIMLPANFLWEIGYCTDLQTTHVWMFNHIQANLLVPNNTFNGYLRIPAQPIDYDQLTIHIFIGEKTIIRYSLEGIGTTYAGKTRLLALNTTIISQFIDTKWMADLHDLFLLNPSSSQRHLFVYNLRKVCSVNKLTV
ncbi:hypothetical protein DFA_05123 [Cavenderia fasciculata]|uniref:MACPF domain-containing protein n=1 Tax=Cavenderia fasciculata TaxID=261658 RepID=F4PNE0_CACFS|nr:uncharacterized protein DFA_05123 [Cavenderia fasciculata]EGG22993.1 hypothetical protein DFA_05123 [Cavenderia fasciculata]|eukprot:XP_004360844.1 hypothetical protein DFA_05123 [Cavenderia fasciculata]